jgi:hypothetical protein
MGGSGSRAIAVATGVAEAGGATALGPGGAPGVGDDAPQAKRLEASRRRASSRAVARKRRRIMALALTGAVRRTDDHRQDVGRRRTG